MIVEANGISFWVSNVNTLAIADGAQISGDQFYEVIGTRQYSTVLGASKTVLEIQPFDLSPYRPQ